MFRFPCLMIFPWISATALRSGKKNIVDEVLRVYVCGWCNSRRQLVDCLAHGVVEIAQPLPVQSSVEGGTDVSTGQPKFDIICPVYHRVLGPFQSRIGQQKTGRKLTLIMTRVTLAEPKTASAGTMLETSLARSNASMTVFNAEIVPSLPLGRWDSTSMVETRGRRERTV